MTVIASATGGEPSRYAEAYALAVDPMSPRLPSATTISPAVRAYWQTLSKDCIPSAPSASKNASWGLTPTAYGATASITPQQNRVHASAASARPSPVSPASSSGKQLRHGIEPDQQLAALALDRVGEPVSESAHVRALRRRLELLHHGR